MPEAAQKPRQSQKEPRLAATLGLLGCSQAGKRRPQLLSVEQGGLRPPEPSSVRPTQGARWREASDWLGAVGGGSDHSSSGDPEVRKRGTEGRSAGWRREVQELRISAG